MHFPTFKSVFISLIVSSSSFFIDASSLPSNALNRWKDPLSSIRGGESTTATVTAATLVSTKPTIQPVTQQVLKKKRKKKVKSPKQSLKPLQSQKNTMKKAPITTNKRNDNNTLLQTTAIKPIMTNNTPQQSSTTSTNDNNESTTTEHEKMPSIFTPEEILYDKYAACLSATEGLRRIRDAKIDQNKKFRTAVNVDVERSSGWKSLLKKQPSSSQSLQGEKKEGDSSTSSDGMTSLEQQKEEYKRACAEYVLNSSKVVKALGLSVSQFNQLGREVKKNQLLKEKVMEQAYLYRLASTIKMDKIPLIQDPAATKLLQSHKRRRVQMFVQSITEIEELRTEQMERLKRALKIDALPPNMNLCDPNVLPLLNPKVRAVIEAFPLQAEVIVKKYGLNSDEFNQMLEETRGNPIFRWRVQRFKNYLEEDSNDGESSNGKSEKKKFGEIGQPY